MHVMPCAFTFALFMAGKSNAARIAMMAITTSNSINVNARFASMFFFDEAEWPQPQLARK
jgi:hypothetical protein